MRTIRCRIVLAITRQKQLGLWIRRGSDIPGSQQSPSRPRQLRIRPAEQFQSVGFGGVTETRKPDPEPHRLGMAIVGHLQNRHERKHRCFQPPDRRSNRDTWNARYFQPDEQRSRYLPLRCSKSTARSAVTKRNLSRQIRPAGDAVLESCSVRNPQSGDVGKSRSSHSGITNRLAVRCRPIARI